MTAGPVRVEHTSSRMVTRWSTDCTSPPASGNQNWWSETRFREKVQICTRCHDTEEDIWLKSSLAYKQLKAETELNHTFSIKKRETKLLDTASRRFLQSQSCSLFTCEHSLFCCEITLLCWMVPPQNINHGLLRIQHRQNSSNILRQHTSKIQIYRKKKQPWICTILVINLCLWPREIKKCCTLSIIKGNLVKMAKYNRT